MAERKLAHKSLEKKAATNLVTVDYFSKSSEIDKRRDKRKSISNGQESEEPFCRHGKPETATTPKTHEEMDDSPTQIGSWDGAPRPTTTRSLKQRGGKPVKVKRHSTQRQTRQRHYY